MVAPGLCQHKAPHRAWVSSTDTRQDAMRPKCLGLLGLGENQEPKDQAILSYLHSLFTLSKQQDEGSRGRANTTAD